MYPGNPRSRRLKHWNGDQALRLDNLAADGQAVTLARVYTTSQHHNIAAFAAYCLANFARCREAHCVVTGTGWAAAALAAAAGAVTGRPTLSEVWLAFALIALLGHWFEAIWRSARGTNALRF